jgi:hypothetical protein
MRRDRPGYDLAKEAIAHDLAGCSLSAFNFSLRFLALIRWRFFCSRL